jgi:preprotein translocase subunit SecB
MKALFQPITSPLQLDRYFLKSLHFELNEGFDRGRVLNSDLNPPELEIGVVSAEQHPENPAKWRFEVCLELPHSPDANFPYRMGTTLVGYFTVSEQYPTEHAERLARINGPAVLYSCGRELVASVTGRSPYPRLLIPSVTFVEPDSTESEIGGNGGPPRQLTKGTERPSAG